MTGGKLMSTYLLPGMSAGPCTTSVGKRSLTWSAAIAFLLTVPVGSVRAQPLDAEKASVVRIESKAPEGPQRIGTGFIVSVDADLVYIATASHVVEGDPAPQIEFFARRDRKVTASIVRSEGGDPNGIALLTVRRSDNVPAGLRPLTFAPSADVHSGQDVAVIGFGRGQGDWAIIRASIASVQGRDYRLDGRIEEGNSGGPVLRDARVVGLVTSVNQGFGVAMPSLFAAAILKGWGIDVSAASVSDPPAGNLLRNAGFEELDSLGQPTQWSPFKWNTAGEAAVGASGHTGTRSVRMQSTAGAHVGWKQIVTVVPKTDYLLTGWIKTREVKQADEGQVGAAIGVLDFYATSPGLLGTHDWTLQRIDFNSGDRDSVTVSCGLGYFASTSTGEVWCDDLRMITAATSRPPKDEARRP